tara:strand:+ start:897 stop:1316 length:420 start_codon:yes stop_codon:yes gene_type:complete
MNEDTSKGGKADKHTPESIAKLHNVTVENILFQIAKGIKVEMEHTDSRESAKEISLDHLVEFPDYYDRLDSMEKKAKDDVKEEMTSGGVVGGSPTGSSGIAPQDNIDYAKGDARMPKLLFKDTKKKKKVQIQRRPKIGM